MGVDGTFFGSGDGALQARAGASRPLGWRRKLAFSLFAAIVFFGALELGLRAVGFQFQPSEPSIWSEGQARPITIRFFSGGEWVPVPGAAKFNDDGFLGPRIPLARVPGALRIATMGDSCTHLGDPPYPRLLGEKLERRLGRPIEVLNAGVAGDSTERGLARFEQVKPYRPDFVSIYFGWNDHWRAPVYTDADQRKALFPWAATRLRRFEGSRVVQAIVFGADMLHDAYQSRVDSDRRRVFRVPPERYRANLRRLVEGVRAIGAQPILVTAPTTATDNVDHWAIMLQGWRDTPYGSHREIHDAYVELTRQAARETGAALVDARVEFQSATGCIMADQIHLTPAGHDLMADLLAQAIVSMVGAGSRGQGPRAHPPADLGR